MQIPNMFCKGRNTASGMVSFLSPFSMCDCSMFMQLLSSAHITPYILLCLERLSGFKLSVV